MTSRLTGTGARSTGALAGEAGRAIDIEPIVMALRATFSGGRTRSVAWRIRQLEGLERLLDEREDEITQALAQDLGRSAFEAWIGDIASTRREAQFARKNLPRWVRRHRARLSLATFPGRGWHQYEPLGLVLIIGPWNYPWYLSLSPLVAAIAAGNCAVVKPSEHAPASSALLARLLPHYIDDDAFAVVEGDAEVTQTLLAQGFDHAFFTGGTEVGKKIMQAAAAHLTPVTLELGGKCPVIVTRNADVAVAARRVASVKLMNSGQTCIAPDYVLVDRAIRQKFVAELIKVMRNFRAREAVTTMRVVNRKQFDRLAHMIKASDGVVVTGGGSDPHILRIEPTVIVDPRPDSPIMTDEIFGPILPVLSIDSLSDGIRFVNAGFKPLASYLFSNSTVEHDRVLREISSGGTVINHVAIHCMEPALPFGGVGHSGMGSYHGRWGFEALSHRKAVLVKPSRPDPSILYPPYTALKFKLTRRFF